ncbi:hypothetical protein QWJ07_34780 [Frankia sp. RB7]|nr:hypothetical protein [Frankia sp. RB7]
MKQFYSLAFAVAVSATVMMLPTAPAVADQGIERMMGRTSTSQHYAARRAIMRAYPATHVAAIPAGAACGGPWCGREFVLMLGIGF